MSTYSPFQIFSTISCFKCAPKGPWKQTYTSSFTVSLTRAASDSASTPLADGTPTLALKRQTCSLRTPYRRWRGPYRRWRGARRTWPQTRNPKGPARLPCDQRTQQHSSFAPFKPCQGSLPHVGPRYSRPTLVMTSGDRPTTATNTHSDSNQEAQHF